MFSLLHFGPLANLLREGLYVYGIAIFTLSPNARKP